MDKITQAHAPDCAIRCAVCQTHSRPAYVPWQQHAIGCSVRAAELQRRELQLRPPLRAATGIGAF